MKIFKRTVSLFLAFCLCAGMLLLQPQSTVSAATTTTPNTKILRMYPKTQNTSAIHVNLPKGKVCYVKNIKTGSKNLIAKNTYYYTSNSSDKYAAPYASIRLYAKKKGKYVVSYDICDKAGKKLSSGKTTVYVSDDQPIKSVKFDKKYLSSAITFKKSGKLSISMNKGYKLKKITVTTYNKSGKEVVKTVRNNSTIKLGEYAQIYDNSYSDGSRYFSTSLAARTQIKITYTDKYTKQKCESSYTINRLAK